MTVLVSVSATPNQTLLFRTGPNTKYVEMYTMPQSTPITALEYEEGNGVTWVLVEFFKDGQRVRGYTGLKRMSVQGSVPWANWDAMGTGYARGGGTVYAAPSSDAAYRATLADYAPITVLDFYDNYAYVEYTDPATGMPSRGYIKSGTVASD